MGAREFERRANPMTAWTSLFWSPAKHRWIVRIGCEGRAQRQATVPAEVAPGPRSEKAAKQWALERFGKAEQLPAAQPRTLAELAPRVLSLWSSDERLAPKTRADRESMLRLHILPAFGELTVDEIDAPKVRTWVRASRRRMDSPSAIRNRLSTLATLLSDLHAEGYAADNRVATSKAVRDELPTATKQAPTGLTLDVFELLLNSTDTPQWFVLLSALAGLAGLEAGAALGLEIRDVHFVDGEPVALTVRQSVAVKGEGGHASIGKTKNAHRGSNERPRIVPVHPALAALLEAWLGEGRERWTCSKARPHDLLVPNAGGKPWRPKVANMLRRELERLGVEVPEGVVFHSLRGCFATWLAAAGVPKDQRQRLMGHAGDVEGEHYEITGQLFETDREVIARIAVEVRPLATVGAVPFAVPFAVPVPVASAQQLLEKPFNQGAPGKNRTCDQRFRNSQTLCLAEPLRATTCVERGTKTHIGNGTAAGNGSEIVGAVPFAVPWDAELRAMALPFEAAEAMLFAVEAS